MLAYIGSAFIATEEANAVDEYKNTIVSSSAADILYTNSFTGVHGNYLIPSLLRAGLDPTALPVSDPSKMDFGSGEGPKAKAWRDIWGCGQGIGAVREVLSAALLVERLEREFLSARAQLLA